MQPISLTNSLRDYYNSLSNTPSSRDAEAQINQFSKMTPRSTDILRGYETQAGVDNLTTQASDLQKNILNTEQMIKAVPDAIATRTSNALVSGAQAQRLTAVEQEPLTNQLGILNTRYQGTQTDLGNARDRAAKYATLDISDINNWQNTLQGRLTAALQREEEERQRAEAERSRRAFEAMIAEQNRQMAALQAQANKNYQDAMARSKYLLSTTSAKISTPAYNPQKTVSAAYLQPAQTINYFQPAKNTVQNTMKGTSLQGGGVGMNLNMSGSGGIRLR